MVLTVRFQTRKYDVSPDSMREAMCAVVPRNGSDMVYFDVKLELSR